MALKVRARAVAPDVTDADRTAGVAHVQCDRRRALGARGDKGLTYGAVVQVRVQHGPEIVKRLAAPALYDFTLW
jgi:hypothetical protein